MIAPNKKLLVMAFAAVIGCGQQLVEFPNPQSPTVLSTVPAASALNATAGQTISVTFSEPMAPATINASTFTLAQGSTALAGTVAYSGSTATFQPASPLAPGTVFAARITTGAQSAATGLGLDSDYTWTFATAATTGPVTPTVIATSPASGATSVAVGAPVTATFSVAMSAATINATTFTLQQGGAAVAGTVSYAGTTATFTPAASLAASTIYTATLTTGAESAATSTGLASAYVWSFTTAASVSPVVPAVIATSPANDATGVAAGTQLTATFSVAMDPATINATTFLLKQGATAVAGAVSYAGVTATFIPTSSLSAGTAYTATITTGAHSAAGVPLAANDVWTFTTAAVTPIVPTVTATSPANNAAGVAINTAVTATFSVAMDPTSLNATTFLLRAGPTAVAGVVTYAGTTATFTPAVSLLAMTVYTATITTGAKSAAGVPLAANDVWTFTTGGSAATVPAVTVVDPLNGASGVATNKVLSATFNEAVSCATVTAATFSLATGAVPVAVPGQVACSGAMATFTPGANLLANTKYTATIKGGASGVKDPNGGAMAADYVWSFTTAASGTAPQITQVNPSDGAMNICPNTSVTATFDSAMDATTLNSQTFTLTAQSGPVNGVVSYDPASRTATFTPAANLATGTAYTATVTNGAKDLAGDALAQSKVWHFGTGISLCQAQINLNSLSSFVAVAGAGLTNSDSGGTTVLNGNVGLYPSASCMGDGSPCTALDPVINGTLYANDPAGVAAQAKADLTSAYNDAIGRPPGVTLADLAGLTLAPGVYSSGSTMSIAVGGTLVLDAQGNANGVWIFQIGSSLTVNNNARVLLVNGAKASNVYWAIFASSTIGGSVTFAGNVLAGASNSVGTGSMIEGRLLCRTGQITLLSDTVTMPSP